MDPPLDFRAATPARSSGGRRTPADIGQALGHVSPRDVFAAYFDALSQRPGERSSLRWGDVARRWPSFMGGGAS